MHASVVAVTGDASTQRAKLLLTADAFAEGICAAGLALLTTTNTGVGTWALPQWFSDPLLWIVAVVFVVTAVALVALAVLSANGRFTRFGLIFALGIVNAALAAVIIVWSLVDHGFGGGSTIAFVVAGLAIMLLGFAQMNFFYRYFFTSLPGN